MHLEKSLQLYIYIYIFIQKVCRKPVQSESDVCVSNGLPRRPQTVATSHPRGRSFQGKNSSSKTWSQDKSQNGAWKARRTRLNYCYVLNTISRDKL